jgi:tRNA(Leu) C34 or U34 (ribose-2'-O)-methylase TrmL
LVEEQASASVSKPRVLVICADVRDPGNAGTVIRCTDASGADGVVLAGHSVDPYNDKTVRATVGSLWHLPLALHDDPAEVVRRAQAAGFVVLAADGAGETDLFDAEASGLLGGRVAWLFGNEAWGLPDELAALADHRVSIPIFGCSVSQVSPRRREARESHASWTSSVSSSSSISPIRLPRSSTDGCPSKCGVVKYGEPGSSTIACLSSSDATQKTITSSYRSFVSGSNASGLGLRKNTNDLPPTW